MPKKCTIDDIARLAGVSRTTVSRVLNHKLDVDSATRERILRIIEEQNFVPSTTASGLAGGRSRLIGMLIPAWAWPLISDLTPGIVEVVKQTQYELVLYSINDEDIERDRSEVINRLLATQLTAGLLAIFPNRASQHLTQLYKQGFPVVIIDDQEVQVTPWVGADNTTGAYNAVRHLIKLGHRRIAHISGPSEYLVSHDRYNGYRQALLEADIPPDPALILEGNFLPPSGRTCASKLFELPPQKRPTAIFAASDQMAYGVLVAAEEYGLSIPQDVALVGFDDDAPSAHIRPALTTVRQPYCEMGQHSIELLLSMLDTSTPARSKAFSTKFKETSNEATGEMPLTDTQPIRIQLPTTLIVRESCGAHRHSSISTLSDKTIL
jgi:LacI family transcriptional regulator